MKCVVLSFLPVTLVKQYIPFILSVSLDKPFIRSNTQNVTAAEMCNDRTSFTAALMPVVISRKVFPYLFLNKQPA